MISASAISGSHAEPAWFVTVQEQLDIILLMVHFLVKRINLLELSVKDVELVILNSQLLLQLHDARLQ